MKTIHRAIIIATALASSPAYAQYTDAVIKIGVLTDMSSLYSDITGAGEVVAVKLAVEDFGAVAKAIKVEIIAADNQNKADLGASIANWWYGGARPGKTENCWLCWQRS